MTIDAFKAIVSEIGGPEGVIGFRQANGTKFYFSRYALSLDDLVVMGGQEFIKLKHKDTSNREAVSYLVMDEVVHVYTIKDVEAGIIIRDILD
jgi:hypothetical protein